MTGKQVVGRIALALLVVGLLAAAGYAIYRLGFSAGVASVGPMEDMLPFMSERGPRLGWPDQFAPFRQEPRLLRPGDRVQVFRREMSWPGMFGLGTPLLTIGVLMLAATGVVALVLVLFRWAFRSAPTSAPAAPAKDVPEAG
jgi:hypothetical protein